MFWYHITMVVLSTFALVVTAAAAAVILRLDEQSIFVPVITIISCGVLQLFLIVVHLLLQPADSIGSKYIMHTKPATICCIVADILLVTMYTVVAGAFSDANYDISLKTESVLIVTMGLVASGLRLVASVAWLRVHDVPTVQSDYSTSEPLIVSPADDNLSYQYNCENVACTDEKWLDTEEQIIKEEQQC